MSVDAGHIKAIPVDPVNVRILKLESVLESPTNPRKTFDNAGLFELAASIKEVGLLQPILVRPIKKGFEVVCGARRLRASKLVDLDTIPAIVRHMTDAQVLDAQIVENLQRQDVHPLEEAECIKKLLVSGLYDSPQAVADKIGRSVRFVHLRLKLCSLHPDVKAALEDGKVGIQWAELASTLEEAHQLGAVAALNHWDPVDTVPKLRRWIQRQQTPLENARWRLDDAGLLPQVGACTGCRWNSENSLFPDGDAMCGNRACFEEKLEAWRVRVVEVARAKNPGIPEVCSYGRKGKYHEALESWADCWVSPHKGGAYKEQALWIDTAGIHDAGQFVWIERADKSNKNAGQASTEQMDALKERKAQIKAQKIEARYRFRLYEAIREAIETSPPEVLPIEEPLFTLLIALCSSRTYNPVGGLPLLPPTGHTYLYRELGEVRSNEECSGSLSKEQGLVYAFITAAGNECRYHDYAKPECPVLNAFADFFDLDKAHILREAEIELMTKRERKEAGLA